MWYAFGYFALGVLVGTYCEVQSRLVEARSRGRDGFPPWLPFTLTSLLWPLVIPAFAVYKLGSWAHRAMDEYVARKLAPERIAKELQR